MSEMNEAVPSTGPVAGKYELVRLIGRGGMGTDWEARHVSLGTRVAIKFIDAEYADSIEARARFDNEARAAATIQSKHAIQIFDHGLTDDGKPYIVMEMLLGEPLDARIDRVGRLSLIDTARILRQVARALARAHERGIVHRDLKPENIFLVRTPDDDDEIAKVLDFGIAKFKKPDGTGTGLTSSTKTGAVLGTPFFMAPEQARGLRDLDHRVDLWALGVIAFRCVCGILPFEGVSVGDLLVKICTTPAPAPSSVNRALPPAFDAWFSRALEKEPARRFQSALELADSLATAAGLSIRHGASLSPISDSHTGAVPAASNPPTYLPLSGGSPNVTSAPFTASSPRAIPASRGIWLASTAAVLLGGMAVVATLAYRTSRANVLRDDGRGLTVAASSPSPRPSSPLAANLPPAQPAPTTSAPSALQDAGAGALGATNEVKAEKPESVHHHPAGHPTGAKPAAGTPSNVASTLVPSGGSLPAPNFVIVAAPATATPLPAPVTKQAAKPASSAVDLGY